MVQAAFHLWGLQEVDLLASSCTTQCQHYYTLGTLIPLEDLELSAFNHPWMFQISFMFPPPTLIPLVLSKFLAEHVKGQARLLILDAPCWMEASWLPIVLNMLADIPHLIMDVSVGHVLKGLPYLHLTLWLLRDVCYADWGSLPQSVRQWWGQLECLHQRSTSSVGRNGQVDVLEGVPNNAISPAKLADFWLIYLGLAWPSLVDNCYLSFFYFFFFRASLSSQVI